VSITRFSNGWVQAKDIKVGDQILTIDGSHINLESITSNKISESLPENVKFTNGQVVSVTEKTSTLIGFNYRGKDYSVTQPIFVKTLEGITYKNAGEIEIGEIILHVSADGSVSEVPVTSIEKDEAESTVYDVRTSPQPWFIVNSFIAIA
jgi:intein/homing endonuclease